MIALRSHSGDNTLKSSDRVFEVKRGISNQLPAIIILSNQAILILFLFTVIMKITNMAGRSVRAQNSTYLK